MQVHRNEITTGLLFLATVGLVTFVVLSLTAPGLFHPQKKYSIFLDSAAGIKPGASVLLAGRKIGQVSQIYSPVPWQDRPEGRPTYEVKITVNVDRDADVYTDAKVSMLQLGMLGEQVLDFSGGNQSSGDAKSGETFVGTRVPTLNDALPKMLEVIQPVAEKATATLQELQETADNLNQLTAKGSDFRVALEQIKQLATNLQQLTEPEGPLSKALHNFESITAPDGSIQKALGNIQKLTEDLIAKDNINKTLDNIKEASTKLKSTLGEVSVVVDDISTPLNRTVVNAEQLMDTLKRQPWRLIWPATKRYPDDDAQVAKEQPQQEPLKAEITIRKYRPR